MKKNLVIYGAGPRGLAVALRASLYSDLFNIYIVDKNILSTWKYPNMISDIEMRSPITFDLTTFHDDLAFRSLSYFLNRSHTYDLNQKDVEQCDIYCSRKQFIKYLFSIIDVLKERGCIFVPYNITSIYPNQILTLASSKTLEFHYLVICSGRSSEQLKYPTYIRNNTNIKQISDLCTCSWRNQEVNVIGSGQTSAELVYYLLSQSAQVNWIRKYYPKVSQYPVPSFKEWGIASALSSHYRSLDKSSQLTYLNKVHSWTPSITPYINTKISSLKQSYNEIIPSDTRSLNCSLPSFLASGYKQNYTLLPFINFKPEPYLLNPYYPELNANFQSSNPSIYFSGLLASQMDGPRQGSIISSASTAFSILSSILSSS